MEEEERTNILESQWDTEEYFVWRIISQEDKWVQMGWGHPMGTWGDVKFGTEPNSESLDCQALESGLESRAVKRHHRFLRRE